MREEILRELYESRIVAIVRGQASETVLRLAEALCAGGIRFMEITFRQDAPETWQDTAAAIAALDRAFPGRLRVGAGTVMTAGQVRIAHDAGARYIISPNVDADVIRTTRELGLVSLPGAFTATEIAAAHALGADVVKVFPAGRLGPDYLRDLRAPMPHIPLMAVGGVNEKNAAAFISAGAVGIGVGGNLVNREWIASGEFDRITALARDFVRAVQVPRP